MPNLLRLASLILAGALFAAPVGATDFWVGAAAATAASTGSRQNSFADPATVLQFIREQRRSGRISSGEFVRIFFRDGTYPLTQPLRLQPEDSGTETNPLVIAAAPGAKPILSGGIQIGGWRKLNERMASLPDKAHKNIWVTDAPKVAGTNLNFRQLWVNGQKAIRARSPNGNNLTRLVAWDKTNQVATIPAAALGGIKQPGQLEMIVDQVWEIAVLRIASIRVVGTNALLKFKKPESKLEFKHPWPPVIVTTNYHAPFFLANDMEFLDEPGEWFEDVRTGKLYYWPRAGEDLAHATVIAPMLETLVKIEGSPEKPASKIQFQGITFAYTTWLRPSEQGHVPLQAGMFLLDAKKLSPKGTAYHSGLDNLAWIGRPPGAVTMNNANHIAFENCTFEHLASAGLDVQSGTHDDLIQGCTFRDIGGNGIQLGKFADTNIETHMPYNPTDEREICTREKISNNVVTDCGNEDWGCVGIGVGYARNVSITHNEIFDLPYTGISVGWSWTKLSNASRDHFIFANHIHHLGQRLGDLGGVYTLSAQPGTIVAENSISDITPSPFVPDLQHWFYLYLDEGSSGITVSDNWCPTEKFLKNANGPGNVWTNNGPAVSPTIKSAAGLEPAFQFLLPPNASKHP